MKPSTRHFLSWPRLPRRWRGCCAALLPALVSPAAWAACSTNGSANTDLGSISSLMTTPDYVTGFSAGLSCSGNFISFFSDQYVKAKLEIAPGNLTGELHGGVIPLLIKAEATDTSYLSEGSEKVFRSGSTLGWFTGFNDSVPLYVHVPPAYNLRADTYTATIVVRWYYSVCTGLVSIGPCIFGMRSSSPGFQTPSIVRSLNWGVGRPVTLTLRLRVEKDCAINAPNLAFGSAPLASAFNPVSQTITIRCSAGENYSVGLSDGMNAEGAARRMRNPAGEYLRYELFKGNSGNDRWGHVGSERRESSGADGNPGAYDGITLQSFTYRGVIDPAQPTPSAGTYNDSIVVDVEF